MERQELEARLADDGVLNRLGIIHRDLQRPIPDWIKNKKEYGHERGQYTQMVRNWMSVYRAEHERKNIDNQRETFAELQIRNSDRYGHIINCILEAVNYKFVLV